MSELTRNLNDINQQYSFLDESSADKLSVEFPQLAHAYLGADEQAVVSALEQESSTAKVILLLPLTSRPEVRTALEKTFESLFAGHPGVIVLDMDTASP